MGIEDSVVINMARQHSCTKSKDPVPFYSDPTDVHAVGAYTLYTTLESTVEVIVDNSSAKQCFFLSLSKPVILNT